MVAPTCFRLAYIHKPCLAKPMLFAALACFEQGDLIGCGVRLREALTRFVVAACDWYGCEVKSRHPRPRDYVMALHKADQLTDSGRDIMLEIITAGNALAHCVPVKRNQVRACLELLFSYMEREPYAGHERKPLVSSKFACDCDYVDDDEDDDDNANWWKAVTQ